MLLILFPASLLSVTPDCFRLESCVLCYEPSSLRATEMPRGGGDAKWCRASHRGAEMPRGTLHSGGLRHLDPQKGAPRPLAPMVSLTEACGRFREACGRFTEAYGRFTEARKVYRSLRLTEGLRELMEGERELIKVYMQGLRRRFMEAHRRFTGGLLCTLWRLCHL